jgi:peptidoglycan hydrolase-like protein with peptidoglycan-binding domain
MAFTNSPLAEMTSISPNRHSPRNQPISKITIHHWAGTGTLETFKNDVMNPKREMSANYAIDSYGHIGLFCPEGDRSWCSSSPWNDHRSVTIEVANSAYGDASGWPISEASYKSLIKLCVDICKRNGIKKLEFTGDRNGSLTYHYMFSNTACPGPWIKARTADICKQVNAQLNGGSSTPQQPTQPSAGYTKSLKGNTVVYDAPNGKNVGTVGVDGVYTITEEKTVGNTTYGKLKSGKGWVIVKQTTQQLAKTTFKVNDLVSIASNATYYTGQSIPGWVLQEKWYISSISGDRAVLGLNQSKNRNIQSPINTKYLTIVNVPKQSSWWSGKVNSQIRELQQILNIGGAGIKVDGIAGDATFAACKKYTIEQGDTGNLIKWVQKRLGVAADGYAGTATMNAIYAFQRKNKLGVGYLGGDDWKYLIR